MTDSTFAGRDNALATSTDAASCLTLDWMRATPSIAIPVYQREYRWTEETCEQLLADVRNVATGDTVSTHFIGSLLVTAAPDGGVTLADGQQRVTTVMLTLAAIAELAQEVNPEVAAHIRAILTRLPADGAPAPKLRPHDRHLDVLRRLLLEGGSPEGASSFEQNYTYILSRIGDEWPRLWQGVQRLEQVVIKLGDGSNPQQIFESLNSTGARLSDDELIHNYIHMGRSIDDQVRLERDTWIPIEAATEGHTREFWRDYLILTADAQPDTSGEFGIYRSFRERYTDPRVDLTDQITAEWSRYADSYRVLLHPHVESDEVIATQLSHLQTFGGAPRPLTMFLHSQYRAGTLTATQLSDYLQLVQTLFVRRAVVGQENGFAMIGTVAREARTGSAVTESILRRTPEDPSVRLALTHTALPQSTYILRRLQEPPWTAAELQVEHIYPQTPTDEWFGGGADVPWGRMTRERQAEFRAVLNTLGNLTLLEQPLNGGAKNRSFSGKARYYEQSAVAETAELAGLSQWDEAAIKSRTHAMAERFLEVWHRDSSVPETAMDERIRVVDVSFGVRGFADEAIFEFATFRDAKWGHVRSVKDLHFHVADALLRIDADLLKSEPHAASIESSRRKNIRYAPQPLADGSVLYQGWATRFLLNAVKEWITKFELQDDFRVKLVAVEESAGD